MGTAPVSAVPERAPFTLSGEVLTRRAVTAVSAAVMVITFAFSLGNVTRLCLDLGITVWIAWLVGPAVDLSVIGLLVGIRFLSLHAATETGELACGTKRHANATITEVSRELKDSTCRSCRLQLGLDDSDDAVVRLEALFILAITLGVRPGELRKLTWDHVGLNGGVVHVWRSASKTGDTKTPKSKRSLIMPKRAIAALKAHRTRQDLTALKYSESCPILGDSTLRW